jgi:ELWxxDGT repeat protein
VPFRSPTVWYRTLIPEREDTILGRRPFACHQAARHLSFVAEDGGRAPELWKSDGTEALTGAADELAMADFLGQRNLSRLLEPARRSPVIVRKRTPLGSFRLTFSDDLWTGRFFERSPATGAVQKPR